jgi:hypothetical protein
MTAAGCMFKMKEPFSCSEKKNAPNFEMPNRSSAFRKKDSKEAHAQT